MVAPVETLAALKCALEACVTMPSGSRFAVLRGLAGKGMPANKNASIAARARRDITMQVLPREAHSKSRRGNAVWGGIVPNQFSARGPGRAEPASRPSERISPGRRRPAADQALREKLLLLLQAAHGVGKTDQRKDQEGHSFNQNGM